MTFSLERRNFIAFLSLLSVFVLRLFVYSATAELFLIATQRNVAKSLANNLRMSQAVMDNFMEQTSVRS